MEIGLLTIAAFKFSFWRRVCDTIKKKDPDVRIEDKMLAILFEWQIDFASFGPSERVGFVYLKWSVLQIVTRMSKYWGRIGVFHAICVADDNETVQDFVAYEKIKAKSSNVRW